MAVFCGLEDNDVLPGGPTGLGQDRGKWRLGAELSRWVRYRDCGSYEAGVDNALRKGIHVRRVLENCVATAGML